MALPARRAKNPGMKKLLLAICVAFGLGALPACDATTGGVRSQQMAPFPYNSPY